MRYRGRTLASTTNGSDHATWRLIHSRFRFLLLVPLLLLLGTVPANAARLALVIGNDSYQYVAGLQNARADAESMAAALQDAGFRVTLRLDVSDKSMKEAVRSFKDQVAGGDEAVFYFSGHGVQLGEANYLLPVDIKGESEDQVKDEALGLQRVLDDLQDQRAAFSLAIVDACRNNPFKGTGHRTIGGRGLGRVSAATGQMVLFSAGTGQEALDHLGPTDRNPNGLFTRVLLAEMQKPGVPVDQVLHHVRDEVVRLARTVNHEQVPAIYDQALGEFYFRPAQAGARATPDVPATPAQGANDGEQDAWDAVKDSQDATDLQVYLDSYPHGRFVVQAKLRQKKLLTAAGQTGGARARPAVVARIETASSSGGATHGPGQSFRDCPDCPDMTVIPAGTFTMGSPSTESGRQDEEGPQHAVSVRRIALGTTHVTRGQFAQFVRETGYQAGSSCWTFETQKWEEHQGRDWRNPGFSQDDNHPVVCVNWDDAKAYAAWLSKKTGHEYRLPSEAEWEYAARAGTVTSRYWGDDPSQACRYANVGDQNMNQNIPGVTWTIHDCDDGYVYTSPVGSFLANAFGLKDMLGNAWEWTADCWHANYNGAQSDGAAWTWTSGGSCAERVLRGVSWLSDPQVVRSAYRVRYVTGARVNVGFRLARTLARGPAATGAVAVDLRDAVAVKIKRKCIGIPRRSRIAPR